MDFDVAVTAARAREAAEATEKRDIASVEMRNLCFVDKADQRSLPTVISSLNLAQGQQIYGEGEKAVLFFQLALGMVRTCSFLKDGQRQIDAFYLPGNVFGLEVGAKHSLSAEAVCKSRVVSYRRRDLETLGTNNKRFSAEAFSYAMQSLARAQQHAVSLGHRNAVERLASFLTDWIAYSPKSEVLTLDMPRQDIADYLGLTIETISRTFAHLEGRGLIELLTARQISLKDPEGLRHLNS